MGRRGELLEYGRCGVVEFDPFTPRTDLEALDVALVDYAGEAVVYAARHAGLLDHEVKRLNDAELTADDVIIAPWDGDDLQRAAHHGLMTCEQPDTEHAYLVAREWTSSEPGVGAFLAYARERTIATVRTDRFLTMAGRIAMALLEFGELPGPHATQLCERAAFTYREEDPR
jgi:hypothetical protein